MEKNESNRQILTELSNEESEHYQILRKYTGQLPAPKMNKVRVYVMIARLFGLTFFIKLMEKGEEIAQNVYYKHQDFADLQKMAQEEETHETKLISLIDEEGLNYMGSVVLGLNNALVEFTGALAGILSPCNMPN